MTNEKIRQILSAIDTLTSGGNDIDSMDILRATEGLTIMEITSAISQFMKDGVVETEELCYSCCVEYAITGLSEKGKALLASNT